MVGIHLTALTFDLLSPESTGGTAERPVEYSDHLITGDQGGEDIRRWIWLNA